MRAGRVVLRLWITCVCLLLLLVLVLGDVASQRQTAGTSEIAEADLQTGLGTEGDSGAVSEIITIPLLLKNADESEYATEFSAHYASANLEAIVWAFCEKHLLINNFNNLLEHVLDLQAQIGEAVERRDKGLQMDPIGSVLYRYSYYSVLQL